jgi:hypothetical protein
MLQICDMGQDGFNFHSEGRRAEDFFFRPEKNPTASAGFEPANLDTTGQHATSRQPKPHKSTYLFKKNALTSQKESLNKSKISKQTNK